MKNGDSRWVWLIPVAAFVLVYGPTVVAGESIFLRVAWDANNVLAFFPWNVFSAREFAAGHFPLWNPYNACGVPHLAAWQTAPLYPLHLLLFANPSITAFDIFFTARILLLATGTYLAAKEMDMGRIPAACAATAAAFGGYFVAYGPMVHMNVEVLFPWAIWIVARQKERWKTVEWIVLAVVFTVAYLGGNGESAFYLIGLTVAWSAWLRVAYGNKIFAGCVFASIAAFIMSGAQVLPFLEYLPHAWHIHPVGSGGAWLDPSGMHSMTFAVGGELGGHYIPYLGASVSALGLSAALRDRRAIFFFAAVSFIIALSYGTPVVKWVTYLPVLSRTASYKYALAPMTVMAALLAAGGIEGLVSGEIKSGRVRRAAAAVGIFAAAFALGHWMEGMDVKPLSVITPLASLAALALVGSLGGRKYAALIVIVVAAELVVNARSLDMKPLLDPYAFANKKEVKYLSENHKRYRVASSQTVFPSNLNLIAGVDDANLLDALYPSGYVKKMGMALGFDGAGSVEYFKTHGYSFPVEPESVDSHVWLELGVKYYLGNNLDRPWMKPLVGELFEDPANLNLLTADGVDSMWSDESWSRHLVWKSDKSAKNLKFRATRLPGWIAYTDGIETPVTAWNDGFIEINAQKAANEIHLMYAPVGWKLGLWISISSLICAACLFFACFLNYKRTLKRENPL